VPLFAETNTLGVRDDGNQASAAQLVENVHYLRRDAEVVELGQQVGSRWMAKVRGWASAACNSS
jgi:hypothetical protein